MEEETKTQTDQNINGQPISEEIAQDFENLQTETPSVVNNPTSPEINHQILEPQPVKEQISTEETNFNSNFSFSEQKQAETQDPTINYSNNSKEEGIFTEEYKKKRILRGLLVGAGVFVALSLAGFGVYQFYFSPKAVNTRYMSKLKPIIEEISDLNKEGNDINFKMDTTEFSGLEANRLQFVDQANKTLDFMYKYEREINKLKEAYVKIGDPKGDAKNLDTDLDKYFEKVEVTIPKAEKMLVYLIGLLGNDEFFKIEGLNYNDYSDDNLDYISKNCQIAEDKLKALDPPEEYRDFNDGLKNFLHLMSSMADTTKMIFQAQETGNYNLYVQKSRDLQNIVSDISKLSTSFNSVPEPKLPDIEEIEKLEETINQEISVLSGKYKIDSFQIFTNKKQDGGISI